MAMETHDYIRNIRILSGGLTAPPKNAPSQYANRKRQYLGAESTAFAKQYAKYSSDYYSAEVQGLDRDNPYNWQTVSLRMADVVNPSSAMSKNIDDYKMILIGDEAIDYVPIGAKIVTMGSTWLMVNPENMSSAYGTGIVRRCNSVWNLLDYYGNVISEPIIVEKGLANASTPDAQDHLLITTGSYNIICQYNSNTKQLNNNSRMILGSAAMKLTGYTDFIQEFTGEYDSVRLCEFTARYEEPNTEIDDMSNHVAGGKEFSWVINLSGKSVVAENATTQLTAASVRNGASVTSTTEYPISYVWSSSDTSIATVSASGLVTGVSEGTCIITCALAQNTAKSASLNITVSKAESGSKVAFKGSNIGTLNAYETATITAAYYVDGVEQTGTTVSWNFSGADENAYSATANGNTATIKCWGGSDIALQVKASYGEYSATQSVSLEGI